MCFTRKAVGWALSKSIDHELTLDSSDRWLYGRKRPQTGLIHHSDRGVQYACTEYERELGRKAGISDQHVEKGKPI